MQPGFSILTKTYRYIVNPLFISIKEEDCEGFVLFFLDKSMITSLTKEKITIPYLRRKISYDLK